MSTDEEFYKQYLCGDEAGLEALMKKYGDPLTLYINGYLHDVHEAEDLMIEAFSYLFTKKPRIRDGGFKAYLYKACLLYTSYCVIILCHNSCLYYKKPNPCRKIC